MMTVDVDGIAAARQTFRRLPPGTLDRVEVATRKAGLDVVRNARQRAPYDTGALRSSITSQVTRTRGAVEARVGPTVHYARFLEEGTSRIAPRPYMRPAFDSVRRGYVDAVRQAVREAV